MKELQILTGCELHVHIAGCLFAEDLLELGKNIYSNIDWTKYIDSYKQAFGINVDPKALYQSALNGGESGLEQFRRHVTFSQADGGDFGRFQAKFNFLTTIYRHYRHLQREDEILGSIIERHRNEGLDYVEYRGRVSAGINDPQEFLNIHRRHAQIIQNAKAPKARYIISLPRWAPLEGYALVKQLFDTNPELVPIIVGLDFCADEEGYPPSMMKIFFSQLSKDNSNNPERALEVAYHVGEIYYDKSLESAIRWCHEAADMGVRRIGHATALGLDPSVSIARKLYGHEVETVSERIAQINYDLQYKETLESYGVLVDSRELEREKVILQTLPPNSTVRRLYTHERLEMIRRRQDFVLDRLVELNTVIEICPTSNLLIGSVPSAKDHPICRFLRSKVNLVIAADDPGIFDSTLSDEVAWVLKHTGFDSAALIERIGDPRRFRFGSMRPEG